MHKTYLVVFAPLDGSDVTLRITGHRRAVMLARELDHQLTTDYGVLVIDPETQITHYAIHLGDVIRHHFPLWTLPRTTVSPVEYGLQ